MTVENTETPTSPESPVCSHLTDALECLALMLETCGVTLSIYETDDGDGIGVGCAGCKQLIISKGDLAPGGVTLERFHVHGGEEAAEAMAATREPAKSKPAPATPPPPPAPTGPSQVKLRAIDEATLAISELLRTKAPADRERGLRKFKDALIIIAGK